MNVSSPDPKLSERELEVLRLISKGLKNKEISRELNISVYTVYNHVQHILRKLHIRTRTEAACWAVRNGLANGMEEPSGRKNE